MSKKLTEWFLKETKPAYVGIYQVRPFGAEYPDRYSHWDGRKWSYFHESPNEVIASKYDQKDAPKHNLMFDWRGLAVKP
jgi:hypothetical protein